MEPGTLYIVATPIGNLEDFTYRAAATLREKVDYIYCEDTRQTRKLLGHYGISVETRSLHAHSSPRKVEEALRLLREGRSIAYLTDSGTPGISDPGGALVAAARGAGIPVSPIPGPSALSAIASVSGFRGRRIIFCGFLSRKEGKRDRELLALRDLEGTIVLYESPHRIEKLLNAVSRIFPGAPVLIGREMTKFHEEFIQCTADDLVSVSEGLTKKGEFTILISNGTSE
ncbi:MAG: 16S rRNA (cytidine(1402)-2'-O)-methyltransferase [Spirochaetes bacterium]|nr:16S rRNA (cytidine(1402)-2'-O)-methyltransferase [Spirochaetota bacterium]